MTTTTEIGDLDIKKVIDTDRHVPRIFLGWNETKYRPEILKFCRSERLQKHEARILRVLDHDGHSPELSSTGFHRVKKSILLKNGRKTIETYEKPYLTLTMGRGELFQEKWNKKSVKREFLLDRISSFDHLIKEQEERTYQELAGNIPSVTSEHLKNKYSSMDWKQRTKVFLDIADKLKRTHDHNVVHGDIKPGNVIIAEPKRGKEIIQIIDYETAIDLDNIEDIPELLFTPTTIPYNSPQHLEQAKQYLSLDKTWQDLLSETTENDFKKRDMYGLARLGQEMILEIDPLGELYRNNLNNNPKIHHLKTKLNTTTDEIIHREYTLEKISCALEAHEKYEGDGYEDGNKEVPAGVREILEKGTSRDNPYDSLDELIDDLEYSSKSWVGKGADLMTRKEFLITAGSLAILGGGVKYLHDKFNSPEYLRKGLLEQYEKDGEFNPADMEYFLQRVMEEQINPALDRAIKDARERGFFSRGLRTLQDGKYALSADNSFIMGYTPRFQLQRAKLSGREEDYENYEFMISNIPMTQSLVDDDWKKFGKIDPLVEFFSEYEELDYDFSEEAIEKAATNLAIESRKLLSHFAQKGQFSYFEAEIGDDPMDPKYEHLINGDSYYLARPVFKISQILEGNLGEKMKSIQPELADVDMRNLYKEHATSTDALLTRTDHRAYSKLYFNTKNGKINGWRSASGYNEWGVTQEHEFFASTRYQAYVIDLLSDAQKLGVIDTRTHENLYRKYKEAKEKINKVNNTIHSPEYIPPEKYLQDKQLLKKLPSKALEPNNMAYAYLMNTITNNKSIEENIIDKKANLLKMFDFGGEGILPKIRIIPESNHNKNIHTDYYAFNSLIKGL